MPLGRLGLVLALLATAACSRMGPAPTSADAAPIVPAPEAVETPAAVEPSTGTAATDPAPLPASPAARPEPARVLIVSSSAAPTHAAVADALAARMADTLVVTRVALDDSDGPAEPFAAGAPVADVVVAIGEEAAALAGARFPGKVVVCQVLDLERHVDDERRFGVEALPSPELQLRSWRRLASDADTLGVIVGTDDGGLVAEARSAAAAVGVDLLIEHAASDREVLYRFKRLAHRVDGLWLLPDEEILSPTVLREVFGYARERGVHTIVFNAAMLDWGALLSVGSDTDDIVEAVHSVVTALANGDEQAIPRITPLAGADVRINPQVAAELGLGRTTTRADVPRRAATSHAL